MLEKWIPNLQEWLLGPGIRIALILFAGFVAWLLVRFIVKRLRRVWLEQTEDEEYKKRANTLTSVIKNVAMVLLALVVFMTVLAELGIDLKPLIAAAGIGGLAVGFGAQTLVKDLISGFFILMENQIRVGDVVEIGDQGGLVESIGLRILTMRDFAGNVHIIPNGGIDKVINMTREFSRYVFDIGVAYREDVDEVCKVIGRVGEELRADPEFGKYITEPMEVFGLDKFDDSALIIKARITTKPIQQWTVGREFNRRLKMAFDKEGIEIPFPHRTVYFGEDKSGAAPSLRIQTKDAASVL